MQWDIISWLEGGINTIINNISSIFGSVSQQVESTISQIENTGQGIFSGLVQGLNILGSWISNALNTLGSWIATAFNYIFQGLSDIAKYLYQATVYFINTLKTGLENVASTIGSFLVSSFVNIYNGLRAVGVFIYNTLTTILNYILENIVNFVEWLGSHFSQLINSVESIFGSIAYNFLNKFLKITAYNITINNLKKTIPMLVENPSKKSFLSVLLSPIAGILGASIISSFIKQPSQPINVFPNLQITPPSISTTQTLTNPQEKSTTVTVVSYGVLPPQFLNISEKPSLKHISGYGHSNIKILINPNWLIMNSNNTGAQPSLQTLNNTANISTIVKITKTTVT